MGRVIADCRRWPSESNCSLTIIGSEDEVVEAAAQHAASVHGHDDSAEFRAQIREALEDESTYTPGERQPEAWPV
jgi:predicted small metal-binding protein